MKTTTLFTNPIHRWPLLPEISPFLRVICFVLLLIVVLTLSAATSRAGSATWNLNPTNGDWNSAVNWTPPTVPNGPADTATFDRSNTTAVSVSQTTEVDGIVFNAGASAFAVTTNPNHSLTFDGAGITNSSSVTQNFVTAVNAAGGWGTILFVNSATAGNTTTFTNQGGITNSLGGILQFSGNSNASTSTIINNGGASPGAGSGIVLFLDSSSAGDNAITNNAASVTVGFLPREGKLSLMGTPPLPIAL